MAMHTSHESDHDSGGLKINWDALKTIKYEDMLNELMGRGLDSTQAAYVLNETGYKEGDAVSRAIYNSKVSEAMGGKSVEDWQKDVWSPMQQVQESVADLGGSDANAALNDISTHIGEESATTIANQISTNQEGQAQDAEDAQAKAKASRLAAADAGLGETRAGLLGSTQTTNNASTYAQANRNLQQSTQNDYLNKMGAVEAAQMQADNMRKGAGLNAIAGGLSGAASGAMAGFVISDENCKESTPNNIDENKLKEQIVQFKQLYKRVKELRSRK